MSSLVHQFVFPGACQDVAGDLPALGGFQFLLTPLREGRLNGCVDPRFSLVTRGSAQYVEWLGASDNPNGKGWAVPGKGYGSKIIALLGQIMAFEVPQTSAPSEPEEQEPEFPAYQLEGLETLVEAGVINSPEFWRQKFSEQVTVGEMFGILGKLFTKVTE